MGLSTNTYIYAGGAQTFLVSFSLGFLSRDDVQVRVNSAVDGFGDPAYTVFTWDDDTQITVTPTLTIGDSVEVIRTVSKTELQANFATATDITPSNLDISAKQGLMVYQELIDGRVEGAESPIVAADRAASEAADAAASAAAALVSEDATAADSVLVALAVVATGDDVVLTNADVVTTNANASITAQDAIDTAADAVSTAADAVSTAADAVSTNADKVAADQSATEAADSAVLAAASAYDATSVAITGGAIDGTLIGGTTPADATFSKVTVDGQVTVTRAGTGLSLQRTGGEGDVAVFKNDAGTITGRVKVQTDDSLIITNGNGDGIQFNADGTVDVPFQRTETGNVLRTVGEKLQLLRDVRDFGATGDGSTNDRTAFRDALAGGNAHVYVPEGVYRIGNWVQLYANTYLELHPNAVIMHDASTGALFMNGEYQHATWATGYSGDSNIRVTGGTIDCSLKTARTEICEAFAFGHCENIHLENITFKDNYQDHFIEFNSTRHSKIVNCRFLNTTTSSPGSREAINIDYSYAVGFPHFGGYDGTVCEDILIQGCTFIGGDVAVGSHSDPTPLEHVNIRVVDCFIDDMFSWGLDVRYWDLQNSRVVRSPITNMGTDTHEYRGSARVDGRYIIFLDDDEATAFPVPQYIGTFDEQSMFMISTGSNSSSAPQGLYWVRSRNTDSKVLAEVAAMTKANVSLYTSALTGTTGTDGHFNMGTGSGLLYLENRSGSTRRVELAWISS